MLRGPAAEPPTRLRLLFAVPYSPSLDAKHRGRVVAMPLTQRPTQVAAVYSRRFAETDEEFADAIVKLASDAEARSRLAGNAREWASRNLDWESRVSEYEQLYRSLLTDRRVTR